MGSQFRYVNNNLSQQSPVNHEQLSWVPRSDDRFGGGHQGGRLVMAPFGEDVLFDALAITDTVAHSSNLPVNSENPTGFAFDSIYAPYKTALFLSTLNQAVSIQPVWSRDLVDWYPFGSAQTIAASTGAPVPLALALSTPTLYLPFVGVQATCATAPTSGALSGWLERLG